MKKQVAVCEGLMVVILRKVRPSKPTIREILLKGGRNGISL